MTDAHEVYGRMAEGYADSNPHAPAREGYELPAVRKLLPDVEGSLQGVLDPLFDAGFVLEALEEPRPQVEDGNLAYFDERTPRFLVLRARKAGTD